MRDTLQERIDAQRPKPETNRAHLPPTSGPIDNLGLLSIVHPRDFRDVCGLIPFAVERAWAEVSPAERVDAMRKFDSRFPQSTAAVWHEAGLNGTHNDRRQCHEDVRLHEVERVLAPADPLVGGLPMK